jgi:hypothetical protein
MRGTRQLVVEALTSAPPSWIMTVMDDQAYAERLFAILTNPDPPGFDPDNPYRPAEDGVDRSNGFGREVVVESLGVADGPHGAELVVEFRLEVPPGSSWAGVPGVGTMRLPLDARWRELSGYDDPAAYAPLVANRVEVAAGSHAQRHRSGVRPASPVLPSREEQWQLLLDTLRGEGEVREVAPGRIELRAEEEELITIVVSADEWEQVLAEHAWGDVEMFFGELLGPRQDDERFLVHYNGDLVRSIREELPPVRGRALDREFGRLRAEHPDDRFGWYAYPPARPEQEAGPSGDD